jgi:alpha-glucuronidase
MKMLNCAPIHEAIRPAMRRTSRFAFPLSGRGWSLLCSLLGAALALSAQTPAQDPAPASLGPGDPAWLVYRAVRPGAVFGSESGIPDTIVLLGQDVLEQSAARELAAGWQGMLDRVPRVLESANPQAPGSGETLVVVGTQAETRRWRPELAAGKVLGADAYRLHRAGHTLLIEGGDARGALYGAFALLREIAVEHSLLALDEHSEPWAAVRWTNEWDNPDGTIERGYAGPSIFFEDGHVRADLERAASYARLLASVGIDGCTINNVNADARLLQPENLHEIARIADVFRPYGVRLSLSIDMSSPQKIGGLATFDPLDPRVAAWWQDKVNEIYKGIPDFAGVIVKADSEGRPGPSQYGRSPADAANVLARALAPQGGLVLYRGFVYNHHLDWHDSKADRARAGYDNFHALDGKFEPNVIVQIKYGPIDFQVREPVSPLFAALPRTNEAIELQITQEYTGQQRHLVYLAPMWKESLDTDMRASLNAAPLPVRDLLSGNPSRGLEHTRGGFVGVSNVGTEGWLGNPLALVNLYAFGRLAWDPTLDAAALSDEWTRLTLGNDAEVRAVVNKLQMNSWRIYESYTGPLGLGTLTDILGPHFGPDPASAEGNGWGQWLRADANGVGMDRTTATGTGYIGQYPMPLAARYESLKTCPDQLLLFMHHVPYTYRLHSGQTVIQFIYDTHYRGAQEAAVQLPAWESLRGKVADATYAEVLRRLEFQAGHAVVWRDAIANWFERTSGIADDRHRVGDYPGRFEAEAMTLDGYKPVDVTPWETASGGKAIACLDRAVCSASLTFDQPDGWYDIAVQYFDWSGGVSHFTLQVAGRTALAWAADADLPYGRMNGNTSTRQTLRNVALHRGDTLQLTGQPEGNEPAPVDYIEITPASADAQTGQ